MTATAVVAIVVPVVVIVAVVSVDIDIAILQLHVAYFFDINRLLVTVLEFRNCTSGKKVGVSLRLFDIFQRNRVFIFF